MQYGFMQMQLDELPRRSLPQEPQQSPRPYAAPPTVFVYERQTWEYKLVRKMIGDEGLLAEDELNALGASGWELAGVVTVTGEATFVFKRVRT
jgi:hypothetical protein